MKKITLDDHKAIIEAYNGGESMNAIANKYGTYATTIKRILIKYDVELRHDTRHKGELYAKNGEKLIEWAKAQERLVTKKELAEVLGTLKLSHSYFIKYPELSKYIKTRGQRVLKSYLNELYCWLNNNHIAYKPYDRTALNGYTVDALLLGDYKNIALQLNIKPKTMSTNVYYQRLTTKINKAKEMGIALILLDEGVFDNLDHIKTLIEKF